MTLSVLKLAITQFSILALVSGVATVLTFFTERIVAGLWSGSTDYGAILPAATDFAIHYGFLIPLICCLSSIICVVVSTKRPDDLPLLWGMFTLIATIELIGLSLIAFFGIWPASW